MKTCHIEGCGKPSLATKKGGLCAAHSARLRRYGSATHDPVCKPLLERFFDRVNKNGPNGCWVWSGYIKDSGYGVFLRTADRTQRGSMARLAEKYGVTRQAIGLIVRGINWKHVA